MTKNLKTLSIILLIGLIAVLFSGCGKTEKSTDEIKIGVNYELSGQVATYGQSSVDGILMAIDEINEAGSVLNKKNPIKIDNKSDSAEATSVEQDLQHRIK